MGGIVKFGIKQLGIMDVLDLKNLTIMMYLKKDMPKKPNGFY